MPAIQENPLALEVLQSGVDESDAVALKNIFMPFFDEAQKWAAGASSIVVTSIDDKDMMKRARETRLALKQIRVKVENSRKELKEESLRKGKAIDGVANVIKFLIVPIETHLEKQENFARVLEEQRLADLKESRTRELSQFVADVSYYDLGAMTGETYAKLLETSRQASEAAKEAFQKSEQERIAKEKAEADERERIALENARLKKEAEEREAKLEVERQERERIEAEIRANKEAEAKAARELEEKLRREKLAPDKEKLVALADRIAGVEMPDVSSDEAKRVIAQAIDLLSKASQYIRTQSINL